MLLSIIIINYKTPALTLQCLASVYKQQGNEPVEVFVVDNDSADGMEELLKQNFPGVCFIQMGYNAGFARANNAALKIAKGDVFLLLNSDTIIQNNAVKNCFHFLINSPYIATGVQLLNQDGTRQISGNYATTGGLNYLLPVPFLGSGLKKIAFLLQVKKPNVPDAIGIVEVDWINGAFLMVKKTAVDTAGLLDEDFFLYAEEAEWCSRIRKTGKLCIYGHEHVIHLQGESAGEAFGSSGKGYLNLSDKKGLQIMLSNFVRIRKEFGLGWFIVNLSLYILGIFVFLTSLFISMMIFPKKKLYNFTQWKGFAKNVLQIIRFSPRIISSRPYFYKVL